MDFDDENHHSHSEQDSVADNAPPSELAPAQWDRVEKEIKQLVDKQLNRQFERMEFELFRRFEKRSDYFQQNHTASGSSAYDIHQEFSKMQQAWLEQMRHELKDASRELSKQLLKKLVQKKTEDKELEDSDVDWYRNQIQSLVNKIGTPPEPATTPTEPQQNPEVVTPEGFLSEPPKPAKTPEPLVAKETIFCEKTRTVLQSHYQNLESATSYVFGQIKRGETPNLSQMLATLQQVVDILEKRSSEVCTLALEIYPDKETSLVHHSIHTALIAMVLANGLLYSTERKVQLGLCGLLHDVGLLDKVENPIREYPASEDDGQDEKNRYESCGYDILKTFLDEESLEAIESHHLPHDVEDKRGYATFTALIKMADYFERENRKLNSQLSTATAHEVVYDVVHEKKDLFDHRAVKSLLVCFGLYPVGTWVEISNCQVGRVVKTNPNFPMRPVVMIEFDQYARRLQEPVFLDLQKTSIMRIAGVIKKCKAADNKISIVLPERKRMRRRKRRSSRKTFTQALFAYSFFFLSLALALLAFARV